MRSCFTRAGAKSSTTSEHPCQRLRRFWALVCTVNSSHIGACSMRPSTRLILISGTVRCSIGVFVHTDQPSVWSRHMCIEKKSLNTVEMRTCTSHENPPPWAAPSLWQDSNPQLGPDPYVSLCTEVGPLLLLSLTTKHTPRCTRAEVQKLFALKRKNSHRRSGDQGNKLGKAHVPPAVRDNLSGV